MFYNVLWGLVIGIACQATAPFAHGEDQVLSNNVLKVMCTTTMLSSIIEAVGGEHFEVYTVVPYGMCPGHFDLTPGEAQKLREADILFCHGFESFLEGVNLGKNTEVITMGIKGNCMIPNIHMQTVQWVQGVLVERQPEFTVDFSGRVENYLHKIHAAEKDLRKGMIKHQGLPVVCSAINRDLVEWMGFNVIAEYPRDEDVSVKTMHAIIMKGRELKTRLVIDNKQSGGKIGRTIAGELNIPFVLLSNFPESSLMNVVGYAYIQALSNNCALVVNALTTVGKKP